ncbi:cytochrome c biogenesis CcdA family protein [Desulfonema magnum]|uniref:Cytochrome c biogenesis protein transmembrane domain-containing protein n=1 Tax=Desulfonema magnum TaxID=45655 RepID=A0A975BNA7_9BACT|nr:cytochrome c biogenesis protein CcdA [Desulfonema magnum]QTA88610.1 Cytochrome c biogenesis protein transmembrane domain-containing protein [Desulfonema magnum]
MLEQMFLTVNTWMSGGVALAGLGCFLWGMISVVFSPCHLASIPLIVGYVGGQNQILEPRQAAQYAIAFTAGLFITIAFVGIICSLLGRMLGEVGPYWTILVGAVLIWVSLDMLGVSACSMSGRAISRLKLKGLPGAFVLGLAYGLLSGSCTFGFIAPILAFITIQQKIVIGLFYITLFGVGHCIPIAVAGSSAAAVKRILENGSFQQRSMWFRRFSGIAIGVFGIYFIIRPFLQYLGYSL